MLARNCHPAYLQRMNREQAIARLRVHEPELRQAGVESLSVCGSVARDEATDGSDVDVVVRLAADAPHAGFAYFGRVDELTQRLQQILGQPVDVIIEPVRKERLQREIEREAVLAF
jgi:predicted nucleotidyltransferase